LLPTLYVAHQALQFCTEYHKRRQEHA